MISSYSPVYKKLFKTESQVLYNSLNELEKTLLDGEELEVLCVITGKSRRPIFKYLPIEAFELDKENSYLLYDGTYKNGDVYEVYGCSNHPLLESVWCDYFLESDCSGEIKFASFYDCEFFKGSHRLLGLGLKGKYGEKKNREKENGIFVKINEDLPSDIALKYYGEWIDENKPISEYIKVRKVILVEEEKIYQCPICGKEFELESRNKHNENLLKFESAYKKFYKTPKDVDNWYCYKKDKWLRKE